MKALIPCLAALALAACGNADSGPMRSGGKAVYTAPLKTDRQTPAKEITAVTTAHDIEFTSIDGQPLPLSQFEGKALLVVNTASQCGYTGQYEGLQSLWSELQADGLVILGVPSNDFGGQEPGTEADVKRFCEINYGVTFPLTEKTTVKGPDAHPFYALASDVLGAEARPQWNFHKILIGPDGVPVKAFPSGVKPQDKELVDAIRSVL